MPFNKKDYEFLLDRSIHEIASGHVASRIPAMVALLEIEARDVAEQDVADFILVHIQAALFYHLVMANNSAHQVRKRQAQAKHMRVAEEALNHFTHAPDLQVPLFSYFYFIQSRFDRAQGNFDVAIKRAKASLQVLSMKYVGATFVVLGHAHCELGLSLLSAGSLDEAMQAFNAIDDTEESATLFDAASHMMQRLHRLMQANHGPIAARIRMDSAQALMKLGRHAEARVRLEPVFDGFNQDVHTVLLAHRENVMGSVLLGCKEHARAQSYFERAAAHLIEAQGKERVQFNENYLSAKLGQAETCFALGDMQGCFECIKTSKGVIANLGYRCGHEFVECFELIEFQYLERQIRDQVERGLEAGGTGVEIIRTPHT